MQSVAQRTGWFVLALGGLWGVLAAPAYLKAGMPGLEGLTYAGLLCLVPGVAFIYLAADYRASAPREVWMVFGGTLLRMAVGLGGALAVRFFRPELNFWEFLVWLVIFYSVTLFFEIFLILKPAALRSS